MTVEEKLAELGLSLPVPPGPAANYSPFVEHAGLIYISGQLPMVDGEMKFAGHVGSDLDVEQGYEAARLCALNGLSQMRVALDGFENLERVIRVDAYVNSAPGFTGQPGVVNGCSDLLKEVLGDRAGHARLALGSNELPLNAATEIAFIVARRNS